MMSSLTTLLLIALSAPTLTDDVATVGLTPGWATFGQTLQQGVATEALQVGSLPTQTDVKTRWPDGSIRFAVVTVKIEQSGKYPIRRAAATKERLKRAVFPAEVRFGTGSSASLASKTKPESVWLDGPLVTETRWSVVPTNEHGNTLSGMRVLFDQRVYRDGARRLAITIENADDTSENQLRKFGVQFLTASKQNGDVDELLWERDRLEMGSGTRFVRRFRWDLTESAVTPDFEPAFRGGALPRYAADLKDETASPRGATGKLRREFDVLGPGDLNPYMGSPGGRPEIAPYTDWTARYLVHRKPQQLEYLLRMADLAGSWPIHIREPDDGLLVSLTERPKFWFDSRGEDHPRSAKWGGSTLVPDNAHVPGGLVFVPYLVTGDRHYADELAFWANFVLLSTWPGNNSTDEASRAGGDAQAGPGRGILATNQVRGFAWGLRNLADAAAFLPDDHPQRASFRRIVSDNLDWLDHWSENRPGSLGMAWLPGYGTEVDNDGQRFAQLWMYDYLAWSIHRAQQLGFTGGTKFRDQVVRFQTELFTNPDYDPEFAGPGRLVIGEVSASGVTREFPSLRDVLKATARQHTRGTFVGYYGPEARLILLIGLETGIESSRARAALNFLNDPKRHPGMFHDPLTRSGFGLAGPDHPASR